MAVELEIKLTLTETDLEQAVDWLGQQSGVKTEATRQLLNRYYDTPSQDLNRRKTALRVRQQDDQFIQTLKTKGEFSGGAHRRNEWEWPLASDRLNTSLLDATPLAGDPVLAHLQPVFETNFERRILMLCEGEGVIEAAIDQGAIVAGGHRRSLNEVEFELKSGDPASLLAHALDLASEVPVFLNLVSKAEQGYYLAGQYAPVVAVSGTDGAPISVTGFLHGLSVAWLLGQSYPVERVDLSQVRAVARGLGLLDNLEAILAVLGSGVPVAEVAATPALGQLQIRLAAA